MDSKPAVDNVKWTRSGRYIATTFRHVIPTLDREDQGAINTRNTTLFNRIYGGYKIILTISGAYYCEADNNLGQTGKAELQMIVLHGPRVSVEKFKEVDEGSDVSVECKVSSNPEPKSIIWTRKDQPRFRQTGRYLQLRNVSHVSGGDYTCVVTNTLDPSGERPRDRSGNATVVIAVRHKPGMGHISPAEPVGIEGKSVTLTCGATPSGHPDASFTWWKSTSPSEVLATSAEFIIRPVTMSSEGRYFCQPYNNYGKGLPASVQLQVVQEPRIVSGLSNQVIRKAGDTNLNLTCLGMGKPSPAATWFKDGTEIDDSESDYYKISSSDVQDPVTGTVTITSTLVFLGSGRKYGNHVRAWDSGEYTCQFDNSVGRAQSAMALKVEHAPIVSHKYDKVAADIGETIDIKCQMKAFPAPVFQWEKDGIAISDSGRRNNARSIRQISDYEYQSTYTIWSVKSDSYGDYVCKASNSMGTQETIVRLVKKGKPEKPSQLRSKETGSNSIVLAWTENFNGGMNNTSFKVEWVKLGSDDKYAEEKWCPGQVTSCQVDTLEQHTTYLVRVKAVNSHGQSDWSEQVGMFQNRKFNNKCYIHTELSYFFFLFFRCQSQLKLTCPRSPQLRVYFLKSPPSQHRSRFPTIHSSLLLNLR